MHREDGYGSSGPDADGPERVGSSGDECQWAEKTQRPFTCFQPCPSRKDHSFLAVSGYQLEKGACGIPTGGHPHRWAFPQVGIPTGGHPHRWAFPQVGILTGGHPHRWACTSWCWRLHLPGSTFHFPNHQPDRQIAVEGSTWCPSHAPAVQL